MSQQNSQSASQRSKLTNLDIFKSWTKETGFVYPSSEIYGGFQAVYDYGHYGILLKNNIQRTWEKSMIQERDDVVQLDSGIFMHPKTWVASGHVGSFDDVLVEDKKTHKRFRADHLVEEHFKDTSKGRDAINRVSTEGIVPSDSENIKSIKNTIVEGRDVDMDKKTPAEIWEVIQYFGIKSPDGNDITEPRSFNLLVKSNMGTTDSSFTEENVTYLRGETCQGIYLEYKNYRDTLGMKLPFGIAQSGKAFRNEIVARQFIFRTREFEQLEMQYFHNPKDKKELFEMWKEERKKWLIEELGLSTERLRFKEHEKLVFYASAAFDVEYNFEALGGFKEIEGIHDRGDYDLTQHTKFSGEKLDYFDQESNTRFTPHIMETSAGLTRLLMAVLAEGVVDEEITKADGTKDTRTVFRVKKSLAPIKVAVLPLSKKEPLSSKAKAIKKDLSKLFMCEYDETASIGKRYRRQDEIGTPYCVTVDFETESDGCVTVRDRDTMKQERVKIEDLASYFSF